MIDILFSFLKLLDCRNSLFFSHLSSLWTNCYSGQYLAYIVLQSVGLHKKDRLFELCTCELKMSNRSSDSSCEWILLDESDENSSLENPHLQRDLDFDNLHLTASECIKSSPSSEELDELDDLFSTDASYPQREPSYVESLQLKEHGPYNNEDEGNNLCNSALSYKSESDADINISSISKSHCYKHKRNDNVNFILNIILALVISTAVGLGTGHFLGWSRKCYTTINTVQSSDLSLSSSKASDHVVKQNTGSLMEKSREIMNIQVTPKNSLWKIESENIHSSDSNDMCNDEFCSNDISSFSEITAIVPKDTIRNDSFAEISRSHSSGIGSLDISGILTQFNKISPMDALSNQQQMILSDSEDKEPDSSFKFPFKSGNNEYFKNMQMVVLKELHGENQESSSTDNFSFENNNNKYDNFRDFQTKVLKGLNNGDDEAYTKNLTHQLHFDLNKVVESLNAIAVIQLSNTDKMSSKSKGDLNLIIKQFSDFQNHLKVKITDIDNFIQSTRNKGNEKYNLKYLQKMVYSLVDSVDHVIKTSVKTFSRDMKEINAFKFSKKISKIIFNSEKKCKEIKKDWLECIERSRFQDSREKVNKSKQWKRRDRGEKDFYKNRKQVKKYSIKS